MNDQTGLESIAPSRKPRSPYFDVKIMAVSFGLLSTVLAACMVYSMFAHNPQGETCAYVRPSESHHLVLDGIPCRITNTAYLRFIMIIVFVIIPMQVPTLIFWAVTAYQIRLIKNPPPIQNGWEFSEFFHQSSNESAGQEDEKNHTNQA